MRIEKEAYAATKEELEYIRELVLGRGQQHSIPRCEQNEGVELAQRVQGSREAHDISIADHDDRHTLPSKLHNAALTSIEGMEECR